MEGRGVVEGGGEGILGGWGEEGRGKIGRGLVG